jgi:hypothetical protein
LCFQAHISPVLQRAMKVLDEIRERRRRELEADSSDIEPGMEFAEHDGCVAVANTRELCAASLLGLEPEFTTTALRLAFKRCALKVHPDKACGSDAAFQRLVKAYKLLKKRVTPESRSIRDLERERAEPMPEPDHTSCGDLERSYKADGFGEWLRHDSTSKGPPKRVAFKDFHKTFENVKKRMSGTVAKHRVEYLPFRSSLAPVSIFGASAENEVCAGSGYSDLVSAYTVQ